MLEFTKPLKLYVFKDRESVDLSIRVSEAHAHTWSLPQAVFADIVANWRNQKGHSFQHNNNAWFIQYKKQTPGPEWAPASYVRISIGGNPMFNYRVDYEDMVALERDYFYQCHNQMYWD